jgi:hypothetical protein
MIPTPHRLKGGALQLGAARPGEPGPFGRRPLPGETDGQDDITDTRENTPVTSTASPHTAARPEAKTWLVIAALCDCGHVAVTVMDDWTPGSDQAEHDHEVVVTGPDWRPLARYAAREVHRRTGLRISGMCTAVYCRDAQEQQALRSEATSFVYGLADACATT